MVFILVGCTPEGTPTDDTDELLLQAAEEIELAGQVTQSFTLPTSLEVWDVTVTITWVSSHPNFISNTGAVTRPSAELGDINVTLLQPLLLVINTILIQFLLRCLLLTGDETFTITFFVDDEEYEKYYLVEFTIKSYGLMYHGIEVKAFFDVESFEITVPELYESHRYSFSPEGDVPYYQDHLYDGVRIYHILNQIYYVVYVDYGDKFERILVPMGQTPEIDEDYKPFGMFIVGWYYYDQALDDYIPYDFSYPLYNYAYLEADLEYEFYEITFVYMDELQEPYVTYIDAWYWMIDINIPTPPNYGINGIYFDPEYTTLVSYDYTFQQDTTLYVELIPLL